MVRIRILNRGKEEIIEAEKGRMLLDILRENGYSITSPCGGNGMCGKCQVDLKGEGWITSCIYPVEQEITVILPDERAARIISTQSGFCIKLPFNPGNFDHLSLSPFGVAIDIGTTSIVFYFVNLITGIAVDTRPILNPQSKYGADVISRINYSSQEGGLKKLQEEIIQIINSELKHFISVTGIQKEDIVKITVTGNTTMLHLLVGADPMPIALAPFTPRFTNEQVLKGHVLGLECNRNATIKILPSISAYVGADIIAGIAALYAPDGKNHLFVDVGTNGEIALMTPEKIYTCATAAGPAFEGANISCGMGAVDGAVSVFENGEFQTIGNENPVGICGSGLIDIVAFLLDRKIVNSEGYMEEPYLIAPGIFVSPADIRKVQLAKSAVYSGIKILMEEAKLDYEDIDSLYLAGGFGNYISHKNATRIGLLPIELEGRIIPVGNSSGAGALLALRSIQFDNNVEHVRKISEYIELSTHENFTMEFAMNMYF